MLVFRRVLKIAAILAKPSANESAYCFDEMCANHGSACRAIVNHRLVALRVG
jgi:hypothetical protein